MFTAEPNCSIGRGGISKVDYSNIVGFQEQTVKSLLFIVDGLNGGLLW
jgi:hypothetical protein